MKTLIFLLTFALLLTAGASAVDYDLIDDLDASYTTTATEATVTLTWTVKATLSSLQRILVYRGDQRVAVLANNATTWTTTETSYGAIQYSVVWVWKRTIYDYQTGVLNLGKLTWDVPSMPVDGYYVYADVDENNLTSNQVPPEWDYEITDGNTTELALKELLDAGKITKDTLYYYAAASWVWVRDNSGEIVLDENGSPMRQVSVTTGYVTGSCPSATYIDMTWDIPVIPGIEVQPILVW